MRNGKDLGTYHAVVLLKDGRGWIQTFETGRRFTMGTHGFSPLNAQEIGPTWECEEDLLGSIEFIFTEGNYSCDCNKRMFLDHAEQKEAGDYDCGDELEIESLVVIKPDGKRVSLI